jgi:hypothetical protein
MDKDQKERDAQDIKETFATEHGERVLKLLSKKCRENEPTYTANSALHTAYQEGMRSVILYLRIQLNKDLSKVKQKVSKR